MLDLVVVAIPWDSPVMPVAPTKRLSHRSTIESLSQAEIVDRVIEEQYPVTQLSILSLSQNLTLHNIKPNRTLLS